MTSNGLKGNNDTWFDSLDRAKSSSTSKSRSCSRAPSNASRGGSRGAATPTPELKTNPKARPSSRRTNRLQAANSEFEELTEYQQMLLEEKNRRDKNSAFGRFKTFVGKPFSRGDKNELSKLRDRDRDGSQDRWEDLMKETISGSRCEVSRSLSSVSFKAI
jgi:hypothetical protein